MANFTGTPGNDTLIGTSGADVLDGRQGNDLLQGNGGSDVYLFDRGYGQDLVVDFQFLGANTDAIQFGAGITRADLNYFRINNDLILEIRGTTDRLTIRDQFLVQNTALPSQIEEFRFGDGTVMTAAEMRAIFTTGGAGNDTLIGFGTADRMDGKAGNDRLEGGVGGDTYVFQRGYGQDTIRDLDLIAPNANIDKVEFGPNIALADLVFTVQGVNLVVEIAGTADRLVIENHFFGTSTGQRAERIEEFRFADGTVLTDAQLRAMLLTGTEGNDVLTGFVAHDVITGNGGDDRMTGGWGNDAIAGGAGRDTAVYSGRIADYTITLNPDGSVTVADRRLLSPDGTDTLWGVEQAQFSDGLILLPGQNQAPVAADDSYAVDEDGTLSVTAPGVLANDTDGNGDDLDAVLVSGPAHGTLTLDAETGGFVYTPNADFNGSDQFTYRASDGSETSAAVTVGLTVNPVNDAPAAADDTLATEEDTPLEFSAASLLANDSDADGDGFAIESFGAPAHGTLSFDPAAGTFLYVPADNFNGADQFSYWVGDGNGGLAEAVVHLTVAPVNDAPAAADDDYATGEDTALTVAAAEGVLANDGDADGDVLGASIVSGPAHGTLDFDPSTGAFVYTPYAGYSGEDAFTYAATDGNGGTAEATVHVTIHSVNDAPVATPDSFATQEDVSVAGNVLVNDSDPDAGDSLFVLAGEFATIEGGVVTIGEDGSFEYTPPADHASTDSFTYTLSDLAGATATGTVSIAIAAIADEPALSVLPAGGRPKQFIPLTILAESSDGDGSETMALFIDGIPAGVTIGDGAHSFTATKTQTTADISAWDLESLTLLYPKSGHTEFTLTVRAVASEGGTTASATETLAVSVHSAAVVPINGTAGDDTIDMSGMSAKYHIFGHDGDDALKGGMKSDLIRGGDGNDWLGGNGGDDRIYGDRGNDFVYGHAGNDMLAGGKGDDLLMGGAGDDRLEGNQGADTYVFRLGDGHDTIDNCGGAGDADRLVFGDGITLEDLCFVRDGDDLVIQLPSGEDSVTIEAWFAAPGNQVDHIEIAGVVLSAAALEALIPPLPVVV